MPPPVRRNCAKLIDRLRQSGDGIKWVPTEHLHLTLKFLGDVDNTAIPDVCRVLGDVCRDIDPFDLSFGGTGGFPNLSRPRVLYAGVEDPSGSLQSMVGRLELDLAKMGFKPEPRDYTPHLTLGRTRSGGRRASGDVVDRLSEQEDVVLGEMVVDTVQLIASFLDKTGPSYQVMDTVEL